MNYLIDIFLNNRQHKSMYTELHKQHKQHKKDVVLLGDGFFARGFLHNIDRSKFNITQIYKDPFINPQDLMYSLQRNKPYTGSYHFRDIFYQKSDTIINANITKLSINDKKVVINNKDYGYDHLVIGLGASKSLVDWRDQINSNVGKKNLVVSIVGMGPTGIELATILSKYNKVDMYDILGKDKVLSYVNKSNKGFLLELLEGKDIRTNYERMYTGNSYNVIFCGGTRSHSLTADFVVNDKLMVIGKKDVYIGGDCANTNFIKNGQVAYNQGAYVAKRLNGEISNELAFSYKPNGISLNIGDKKVIIEGHNILRDGIYPDIVIRMYSLFCI
jgi:NADH dehydrogenase FAD-containing subunit